MTLIVDRLEALVVARAHAVNAKLPLGELVKPLGRFAPAELTAGAWRDRVAEVVAGLQAQGVLDADHRVRDDSELGRRIGRHTRTSWAELSDRVLPGLALGIAADDAKAQARLVGRDAWAAAIVGRALGLWSDGPPPSLTAVCDALVWYEHGLVTRPKRCPPEIRAAYLQRRLGSEAAPPERLVRVLAAREVGAPRPELRALRDALVRGWLVGRRLGASADGVAPSGGSRPKPEDEPVGRVSGRSGAVGVETTGEAHMRMTASSEDGKQAARGEPSAGDGAAQDRPAAAAVEAHTVASRSSSNEAPGASAVGPEAAAASEAQTVASRSSSDEAPRASAVGPEAAAAVEAVASRSSSDEAPGASAVGPEAAAVAEDLPSFAAEVLRAAGDTTEGWFGDRKVFVSAVWNELRKDPRWTKLALAEFKARLMAAHRAGALTLARADLVAAMDPALVSASEIETDGASFHFIVKEPAT